MEGTGVAFELLTFWSHIWFHFKRRRNSVTKIHKLKDAGFIDAWTIKGKDIVLRIAKMKIYLILVLP